MAPWPSIHGHQQRLSGYEYERAIYWVMSRFCVSLSRFTSSFSSICMPPATMTTKSAEPPQKKIRSSASELACLPAELLGRAATFLNLTYGENEVMPLLLALAPLAKDGSTARTIKHWYLKDNAAYLRDYLYEQIKRFEPVPKERIKEISASLKYWWSSILAGRPPSIHTAAKTRKIPSLISSSPTIASI